MAIDIISIREWQTKYAFGDFNACDYNTMCAAGWVDWFCMSRSLKTRLDKIAKIIMRLNMSDRIDIDKMGIMLKNQATSDSSSYDSISIYNLYDCSFEYIIDIMSDSIKQRYGANYAIFDKKNFAKPVYTCRSLTEVVKWLNCCDSCEV